MKGTDESAHCAAGAVGRRPALTTNHWCWGAVVSVAAAAALALAACGSPATPHVASLSKSGGSSTTSVGKSGTTTTSVGKSGTTTTSVGKSGTTTTTTAPKSDATRLLDAWAACMRQHGDPNQADPTVTADKLIDISWNPAIPGGIYGTNKGGQGNLGPGQYCRTYLNAAQTALRAGQEGQSHPSEAELLEFSECMRAHGVTAFPDPSDGSLSFSIGAVNPSSPTVQKAAKVCDQKTGLEFDSATPPPGTIELNGATPGQAASFGGGAGG